MNSLQNIKTNLRLNISIIVGILISICFIPLILLPTLRGPNVQIFVAFFLLASFFYGISVFRIERDTVPIIAIWVIAISGRLLWLLTSPSLSDDVFRYIWDGHLMNLGQNPFAEPVNSGLLDAFTISIRSLVNNDWMASPYLPSAQVYFAMVTRLAPKRATAFQIGALILDLGVAWMIMRMLPKVSIASNAVLIYLWNPLVMIEFSHGAHVDALMIFLMVLALFCILQSELNPQKMSGYLWGSVIAMAAATLTKGLPLLLVPLFLRKWRWKRLLVYLLLIFSGCAAFAVGAGWGIMGPINGKGVFGAFRIYASYWQYNAGLYKILETIIDFLFGGHSGGEIASSAARLFSGCITGTAAGWAGWKVWQGKHTARFPGSLFFFRLALLPIGVYLLFAPTVHPWYLTIVFPFLPFFVKTKDEQVPHSFIILPWIWFGALISLSYLSYTDIENFHEYSFVSWVEYLPFYALLIWSVLKISNNRNKISFV
ncbi:MAG: hypothetical protein JEZ06_17305 [Anaerolineaceae bacterium]|nr:hypothetical protein [Anaerolineaceae bacterium]